MWILVRIKNRSLAALRFADTWTCWSCSWRWHFLEPFECNYLTNNTIGAISHNPVGTDFSTLFWKYSLCNSYQQILDLRILSLANVFDLRCVWIISLILWFKHICRRIIAVKLISNLTFWVHNQQSGDVGFCLFFSVNKQTRNWQVTKSKKKTSFNYFAFLKQRSQSL